VASGQWLGFVVGFLRALTTSASAFANAELGLR
jgi:hypothetical protein